MKRSSELFCIGKNIEWEALGGGVSRKILGWDNQITLVAVKFEKGGVGAPHSHFHTQATYCVSGKFEFTIGDEMKVITGGDGIYVPPNTMHGAVCLEAGVLADSFSPVREDFIKDI